MLKTMLLYQKSNKPYQLPEVVEIVNKSNESYLLAGTQQLIIFTQFLPKRNTIITPQIFINTYSEFFYQFFDSQISITSCQMLPSTLIEKHNFLLDAKSLMAHLTTKSLLKTLQQVFHRVLFVNINTAFIDFNQRIDKQTYENNNYQTSAKLLTL